MTEATQSPCVTLRAGFAPLTTLILHSADIAQIKVWLSERRQEAPAMFDNLPCALDLSAIDSETETNEALANIISVCREQGLMPIGVRNINDAWRTQVQQCGLADLGRQTERQPRTAAVTPTAAEAKVEATVEASPAAVAPARTVRIQQGNVRSGQQIYSDGDLIVIGMVSAGAEVLARGDIHVYGALRGRALAGVKGDACAVISCQQFEAELIAIAGQYRLFEEQPEPYQKAVVVQLKDDCLNIEHDS
jgi:septum site-determining protein MinC